MLVGVEGVEKVHQGHVVSCQLAQTALPCLLPGLSSATVCMGNPAPKRVCGVPAALLDNVTSGYQGLRYRRDMGQLPPPHLPIHSTFLSMTVQAPVLLLPHQASL